MRYLYEYEGEQPSPEGNNSLGSADAHLESAYYDSIFPQSRTQPLPIQLRGNIRALYGKVDLSGFVIKPKPAHIAQIDTEDGEFHQALYLVKECFEELSTYYSKLESRNKLKIGSVTLKEIIPKRSWSSTENSYKAYRKNLIDEFVERQDLSSPIIVDYASFESNFLKYYKKRRFPFTFSGYGCSKFRSPLTTGLVIDLSIEDASDDKVKYEGFLNDANFKIFRKSINRFGFRFDAHVPWRLYFDVSHEYSRKKMAKYGISNLSEFFDKYYERVAIQDAKNLKGVIFDIYETIYSLKSSYTEVSPCSVLVKEREILTLDKLNFRYQEKHWIRLYAYLRALETHRDWKQSKFDSTVRKATETLKYRNYETMIQNLEPHFTDKTLDIFSERDLTKQNSFGRIITDYKF